MKNNQQISRLLQERRIDPNDPMVENLALAYQMGLDHGLAIGVFHGQGDAKEAALAEWKQKQEEKVAQKQGLRTPYYGAIAGAYKYSYIPTSLGCVVTVRNSVTGDEIDLSDYENW